MKIEVFRKKLEESKKIESQDINYVLSWLDKARKKISFSSQMIPLNEMINWKVSSQLIAHISGGFFSINAVRTEAGSLREVSSWDQPIFNQKEGGILAILCRIKNSEVQFLIQAKAEPGNINILQLSPTVQATYSNLNRLHNGKPTKYVEYILSKKNEVIYSAKHNEEGGRFWRKSNENRLVLSLEDDLTIDKNFYIWLNLSQLKKLALMDNILSPFVKTIISPL